MRLFSALLAFALFPSIAFSQQSSLSVEEEYRQLPDPARMREYMRLLSAHPHHLGSAAGKEVAEWILARFTEWGLEARIETFYPLFPTPRERLVHLVEPISYTATLREPPIDEDPTSVLQSEQLPTYNAYSADGDVTASVVYVNYGIPEDYDRLKRLGISVKGAIVLARYGASWRGIKPKLAAEHGAVGCLIYSDPRDDGYFEGDVFPAGPFRNSNSVQRGSVMDMPLYTGDPLTPGKAATKDAPRLTLAEAKTLTTIPVLPISYGDAQPILQALGGPVAPPAWRGALPLTYHIGPGPAKVHMKVAASWDLKPIHNVIGFIRGSVFPDEWVIRGNHHDAWVNGAQDPISGLVSLLEEARSFGTLTQKGWRPQRTIVYCAWDAEEEGLIGSTEWVEAHADELTRKAVAYINSDANGRGYLHAGGSHTLEPLVNDVARAILDPETDLSVWQRRHLLDVSRAATPDARSEVRGNTTWALDALGSGSDFTPFLQHLGVASLNLGYGGEDDGGIYHSIYDSFTWYINFSDSSFAYGRALAQTAGTVALRLADTTILPSSFASLARTVKSYVGELKTLLKTIQKTVRDQNEQIAEGVYDAIGDPRQPMVPPRREEIPPHLNFAPLENAVDRLEESAIRYEKNRTLLDSRSHLSPQQRGRIDSLLIQSARKLTSPEGLPGRSWYKHLLYAPGVHTGYGVKTLPGVREAIEAKSWKEAEAEIVRLARVLQDEATVINSIAEAMREAR